MPTPDRTPGNEFVQKLIFEDEGQTADAAAEMTYLHGSGRFSLRDAAGEYDPRPIIAAAMQPGDVLFSLDGSTFTAQKPIVGTDCWLADDDGELIVEG